MGNEGRLEMASPATDHVQQVMGRGRTTALAVVFYLFSLSQSALAAGDELAAKTSSTAEVPTAKISTDESPLASRTRAKRIEAQWKLGIMGESFASEDGRDEEKNAHFGLGAKAKIHLLPVLELRSEFGVGLDSGRAQSRYGDHVPESGLSLKEAVLSLQPIPEIEVAGGAIDQGALKNPLLVSERAFPGAFERVRLGGDRHSIELRAQQVIPTSVSLATEVQEGEPTPSFMSETVGLSTKPWRALELKVQGTTYRFRDLPAQVAADSIQHGNSVMDLGPETSRFVYEYAGWSAGGSAAVRLMRGVKVAAGSTYLQNDKAPATFNVGLLNFVEAEFRLPWDAIRLTPRGEYFFSESDASPAFYNSDIYGHSNRKGYAAALKLEFPREKFSTSARFVDADVINPSLLQYRQQYVMFTLETMYDDL